MPILGKEIAVYPSDLLESTTSDVDRQWWAIFTRARHEKALARDLLRFKIPFYLPLVPKENKIRGRTVKSYIPLFSGYVFLYGTHDERTKSRTTNHVSRVLPVLDQVQLQHDLKHLDRLIKKDVAVTIERQLEPGQLVQIKSGSMKGVEGIITQRRGGYRLLVAVQFLQNGVSVEIDESNVEPA